MNSTDALTAAAASAAFRTSPDSNPRAHYRDRPSSPLVPPETSRGAGREC